MLLWSGTPRQKDHSILLGSSVLRVILSAVILWAFTNKQLPLFVKILLIIIIDCSRFHHYLNIYNDKCICKSKFYQFVDKITDTICSFFNFILYSSISTDVTK